jgi:putative phage-type endonuclease
MSYKPIKVGKFKPGSDEWNEVRKTGVGASEAASILGVEGAFSTPLQIWAEKRGVMEKEEPDERLADLFHFGHVMEPIILQEFAWRTGHETDLDGYTYRNPEFPFIMATPDAWALDEETGNSFLVELKNISEWGASDWEEEPPAKYQVQLQHQMFVMGVERGILAAIVGGNRFVWWETTANEKFHRILIDKLTHFWQKVTDNVQPHGSGKDIDVLKGMHGVDPAKIVEFPARVHLLDENLQSVKETIKAAEKEKAGLEAQIWELIGDAKLGVMPNGGGYKVIEVEGRRQEAFDKPGYKFLRRVKK